MNHPLPLYQPVLNVDAEMLDERNWNRVPVGSLIRGHYQAFIVMPPPRWELSCFWAKDGRKVTGMTAYRAPRTWRAWRQVIGPLIVKWWNRVTKRG